MKLPFFRSKNSASPAKGKKNEPASPGSPQRIVSNSDVSTAAHSTHQHGAHYTSANPATSAVQAIAGQMAEMESFLATIDGFQDEAQRLFPENMALGQILNELREECRRRVDYMTRVSAPPAWMGQAQHERRSSSSSTTIAAAALGTPPTSSRSNRRAMTATALPTDRTNATARFLDGDVSPLSNITVTSNGNTASSASSSSNGKQGNNNAVYSNKGNSASNTYFSRHHAASAAVAGSGANSNSVAATRKSAQAVNRGSQSTPPSPLSSPTYLQPSFQSPAAAAAVVVGTRRDGRAAEQRRKNPPQSMFVSSSSAVDITASARTINGGSNRQGRVSSFHTGSQGKFPRATMLVPSTGSPRIYKQRTSSTDLFTLPQLMTDVSPGADTSTLHNRRSANTMRAFKQHPMQQQQSQPMPQHQQHHQQQQLSQRTQVQPLSAPAAFHHAAKAAAAATNDYVLTIKLAGHKTEATVSSALQTSLVSLPLANILGVIVNPVPANSRVWANGGRSWPVIGEIIGMPFVCGNMTFTHSFKVVQGSAGAKDMPRDIMLGNDFCIGNKGRIKDNHLHLEQLCMPITVPVRQITAS
ncbi:hypothetical protein LPJ66_000177 [Kickxella alabastrina]|uniref:Uncharacterized protein n=1 Tax=Kickxella alabastrina TaxID=61397 RepID=A0ACC1IX30_9FUNG|nr:hypothetical protein LPJ66_000177 [Kickxella alabastrina]